nr:hypothetical protein [Tanacetum cinerariifolium]
MNTYARENSSKTNDRIDKLADQISTLVDIFVKKVVTLATVKAVEESCVTCGGKHAYYNRDATNSNQSSVCAATGTYNQVVPQNRASNYMAPPGFAPVQNGQNRLQGKSQIVQDELVRLGESMVSSSGGTRALTELCLEFEDKFLQHIMIGEAFGSWVVAGKSWQVLRIVLGADGYQPYLISPEKRLMSLIKIVLEMAKEPLRLCVDEDPEEVWHKKHSAKAFPVPEVDPNNPK